MSVVSKSERDKQADRHTHTDRQREVGVGLKASVGQSNVRLTRLLLTNDKDQL